MQFLKTARDLLVWAVVVVVLAFIPAGAAVLIFYRPEFSGVCASRACLEHFTSTFDVPINVFIYSFYGVVAIAAVLQLKEQKEARAQAENSAHSAASLSHLNEFRLFIFYEQKLLKLLTEEHISATLMHSAFFPELSARAVSAHRGASERERIDAVVSLRQFIVRKHNEYGNGADGFERVAHLEEAVSHWAAVGVFIGDIDWTAYCDLESDAINLLNRAIHAFRPDIEEFPTEISYYAES